MNILLYYPRMNFGFLFGSQDFYYPLRQTPVRDDDIDTYYIHYAWVVPNLSPMI